ncbi:MerR family transcriptional regulator [Marinicauda salina]|uniref:MerR family transcriptional regulator n=1 Tax=Marinicauda salina TaxID=2135793 RepID=A0A2U2BVJ6_9PROT|nr:MerR family transcriptional regulator [Marinicauda salina]PWE17999.1 MerR family transcriptional regulator [Marinicauda salina]
MTAKSPDAYRTISEAAAESELPAHVLRFWESKFSQLKPLKRKGGRRLYRPQDIALLKGLRRLLYEEGLTIKGAQKYLKDHGVAEVAALGEGRGEINPGDGTASTAPASSNPARTAAEPDTVRRAIGKLEHARERLSDALGE